MKFELELIRSGPRVEFASRQDARKELRLATDALIHDALKKNDIKHFYIEAGRAMLTVARICDQYRFEPELVDAVEGGVALIEQGRAVLDRGLTINSHETSVIGIVMMGFAIRGICESFHVPYEALLKAVHGGVGVADLTEQPAAGGEDVSSGLRPPGPEPSVADPV